MTSHTRSPHRDAGVRPKTGTRLLLAYPTELAPEWIVLPDGETAETVVLAPMTDLALVGPSDLSVIAGQEYRSVCRLAFQVVLPIEALATARTVAVLEEAECTRLRRAMVQDRTPPPSADEARNTLEYEEHTEELRAEALAVVETFGGRMVEKASALRGGQASAGPPPPRPERVQRRRHRAYRMAGLGSTLGAAVICAFAFMMPADFVREQPGLYTWRGSGRELGFELDVNGRRCMSRKMSGGKSCAVCPGDPLTLVYRMDPMERPMAARVTAKAGGGAREWVTSRTLEPTVKADGREKCRRGWCRFYRPSTSDPAPSEVRVDVSSPGVTTRAEKHRVAFTFKLDAGACPVRAP